MQEGAQCEAAVCSPSAIHCQSGHTTPAHEQSLQQSHSVPRVDWTDKMAGHTIAYRDCCVQPGLSVVDRIRECEELYVTNTCTTSCRTATAAAIQHISLQCLHAMRSSALAMRGTSGAALHVTNALQLCAKCVCTHVSDVNSTYLFECEPITNLQPPGSILLSQPQLSCN
jgi:hypothetical protein